MTFDATTISAVRNEVQSLLVEGRVERVIHPADMAVALEIYARGTKRWLLASAHPQQARVYVSSTRLARASDDVSPLLLLMRKYVRDARLVAVEQPPWERVLSLRFEKRDDGGTLQVCKLIIEVMGRHSNIVLVSADGRVLDSIKRVSAEMSRHRTMLPGRPYAPPPAQAKTVPAALGEDDLRRLCGHAAPESRLWQALVDALAGFSPQIAREVAFRATGDTTTAVGQASWQAVAETTRDLVGQMAAGRWSPCLGLADGQPVAFAAYELRQYAERRPVESISEAVEAYYARATLPTRAGETGKAALRATIASLRERAIRRQTALRGSLPDADEIDRRRTSGELVLAYASQVQASSSYLDVDGQRIELDPDLSAVENAQRYFREYHKAKAAMAEVPSLLEEAAGEIAFLDQVSTDLDLASSPAEMAEVRHELIAAGLLKEKASKGKKRDRTLPIGRPIVSSDGMEILIGRSARQNERVTFELGAGGDLWLHARGVPGAHVLVKARGRDVPDRTLHEAAAYAAHYSQSRGANRVAVDYTLQKHVRRLKGAPPGMVTYSGEKTLHVQPLPPPDEQ